jgi:hypothetical protein
MRDYQQWHEQYDDPESGISWRLGVVRRLLAEHLDTHDGPQRVLSLCAGDGRDVIGVLRSRPDASRVGATLVEVHPDIAAAARDSAAGLDVEVRTGDAGEIATFADVLPVDLLLLVGIFGNISAEDIEHTVRTAPSLCRPGATVLWSRSRGRVDLHDTIRGWWREAGCTELETASFDRDTEPAVGAARVDGAAREVPTSGHLFTFLR